MTHVQDDSGASVATATHAEAFTSDVTAGSIVCGGIRFSNGSNTLTSVAKSAGTATIGTVTLLHNPTDDAAGNSARSAMWYAVVTGSGTLTMLYTLASAGTLRVIQAEASGVDTAAPLKSSDMNAQSNPGTGANAITSTAAATAGVSGDYVWGWVAVGGSETPAISEGPASRWARPALVLAVNTARPPRIQRRLRGTRRRAIRTAA